MKRVDADDDNGKFRQEYDRDFSPSVEIVLVERIGSEQVVSAFTYLM